MKAKEFIIELKKESKPRNFVAKNASLAGKAGQHKDKKKAEKQGDVKHKTKQYAEDAVADFLARGGEIQQGKFRKPRKSEKTDYGSKHIGGQRDAVAGKAGKTLGRAAATNFKGGGNPVVGSSYRGEGVAEKARDVNSKERYHFLYPHVPLDMHTDHEYNDLSDNDLQAVKSHQRELADKLGKPGAKEQSDIAAHIQINRSRSQYDQEQAHRRKVLDAEKIKRQARDAKRKQQSQQGVAEGKDDKIAQLKKDHDTAVHWSKNETSPQKREAARQKAEKIKAHLEKQYKQGVAERARDPEDWDEGNTEPPNNFAVYINGKKWKIFKGRGRYADDQREQAHYQQLKDWAAKKSASTGKQWTVSITGETATESLDEVSWKGIKQGAAAAGLAGAMAFGAGGANARVTPDGQGGYTGGFKPTATVTAPSDNKPADAAPAATPTGFSKQYLQKAADPDRFGRYLISVEKAQELLKQMDKKVGEGSMFAGAKVGHKEGPAGQWRNDGAKKNKPAKPGDLVGGGM